MSRGASRWLEWSLRAFAFGSALVACERASSDDAPPGAKTSASSQASASLAPTVSSSGAVAEAELETVDDEPEVIEAEGDGRASCDPVDAGLKPVQLLRFAFASAIERKDPRDRLSVARPGQRVFTHLTLRNRSGRERCVTIELSVGGVRRTTLVQKLGRSWSWRTWGYNTLRDDDRGKLEAVVRDDQGNELARRELAIVPER